MKRSEVTMKGGMTILCLVGLALLLGGCASVQQPYIPSHVGSMQDSLVKNGLQIEITPESQQTVLGEPITFEIRIRNAGSEAFWFTKNPTVLFTWVYPDGRRDNFLREIDDEKHFAPSDVVLLQPGDELVKHEVIPTYYFHGVGVTEFTAVVHCPRNTNPDVNPFWCGKTRSNAYGVELAALPKGYGHFLFSRLLTPDSSDS